MLTYANATKTLRQTMITMPADSIQINAKTFPSHPLRDVWASSKQSANTVCVCENFKIKIKKGKNLINGNFEFDFSKICKANIILCKQQ